MSNGATGGIAGLIAMTTQTANALKAVGAIIFVNPEEFLAILEKSKNSIVVYSPSGFLSKHKYMTNYKGFTFYTKSKDGLILPGSVEVITAKRIIVPEM